MSSSSFSDFQLSENILKALEELGYKTPTPIQEQAIPEALLGHDVIAQAQTGTGKTAAFALPCLAKIKSENNIQVLVLTPTRELSQQVSGEFLKLGKYSSIKVATVVGGKSYRDQLNQLKVAQVLVATPGRLTDLLRGNRLKNFSPQYVILDEADRMLDMGFADDLEQIFSYLPEDRQTLLFSATYPREIQDLANKVQKKDRKKIQIQGQSQTNENIDQSFFVVGREEKEEALMRLIDFYLPRKAIIFCEMKKDADKLGQILIKKGFTAMILHGDTEQNRREDIMRQFKKMPSALLVATDLAGRGLDVSDVSHVINYQIPWGKDSYIHRIGRTGRAGLKGEAFSLVLPQEIKVIKRWAQDTNSKLNAKELPSLKSVQSRNIENLSTELENVEVSPDTWTFLAQLEESADLTTVAGKLLEKVLEKNRMKGKEKLGFSLDQISGLASTGGGRGKTGGRRRSGRGGGGRGGDRRSRGRDDRGSRSEGGRSFGDRPSSRDGGREFSRDSGGRGQRRGKSSYFRYEDKKDRSFSKKKKSFDDSSYDSGSKKDSGRSSGKKKFQGEKKSFFDKKFGKKRSGDREQSFRR